MSPRQCLIIPEKASSIDLLSALESKINDYDIASILVEGNSQNILFEKISQIRDFVHQNDIALLIRDQFELVTELQIDGVHMTSGQLDQVKRAQDSLGNDYILGAEAGLSRHEAMLLGELGSDYIAFSGGTHEAINEMCAWWMPLFQIPCVAFYPDTSESINDNSILDFYTISLSA